MKFDPRAVLAWKLDRDAGYRAAGRAEWELAPLSKLVDDEAQPLRLDRISPSLAGAVEGTLTPVSPDTVRVDSTAPMAVLFFGDDTPQRAASGIDVPYGAVLRVGPLQLSVLFEEHAEAVSAGEAILPEIDAAHAVAEAAPPAVEPRPGRKITARDIIRRLPHPGVLLMLGIIFLAWGYYVFYGAWLSYVHLPSVGVEAQGRAVPYSAKTGNVLWRSVEIDGQEYLCGPSTKGSREFEFVAIYDPSSPELCRDRSYVGRLTDGERAHIGVYLGSLVFGLILIFGRAYRQAKLELG